LENNKVFIDSCIWLYTADNNSSAKQSAARSFISSISRNSKITTSVQVLGEFSNVAIRKYNLDAEKVKRYVEHISAFELHEVGADTVFAALDIAARHQIAFWDAMLTATAKEAGCSIFYSEDLNHEQTISGVQIINPFLEGDT